MALNISRGRVARAQKVVLYGVEGIGKTSLAAKFPDPLFIDTEGGTLEYDGIARTEQPRTWAALMGQVREVARERPCSTLVVDTADWAESLLCEELCAKNKWGSMEALGYGKCWQYAQEEFGRFLDALGDVVDAGINVVVTAHAQVSKFDQPDEAASYDRWTLKLNKKDAAMLKEWADALIFLNYKTIVEMVGEGIAAKGKARGQKRRMFTAHHAAWDAKNRWGLPEEADMAYEVLAPHITGSARERAQEPAKPATAPAALTPATAEAKAEPKAPQVAAPALPAFWDGCLQLMARDGVTLQEVRELSAMLGNYTMDTPPENYDPDYVGGFLAGNWDRVMDRIRDMRDGIPF